MATTEPINTQQVLQMGSHTEKLQQTIQQQNGVLSQYLEEEQMKMAELKSAEVQDPEEANSGKPTDRDGKRKNDLYRTHSKPHVDSKNGPILENNPHLPERLVGKRVNVIA